MTFYRDRAAAGAGQFDRRMSFCARSCAGGFGMVPSRPAGARNFVAGVCWRLCRRLRSDGEHAQPTPGQVVGCQAIHGSESGIGSERARRPARFCRQPSTRCLGAKFRWQESTRRFLMRAPIRRGLGSSSASWPTVGAGRGGHGDFGRGRQHGPRLAGNAADWLCHAPSFHLARAGRGTGTLANRREAVRERPRRARVASSDQ